MAGQQVPMYNIGGEGCMADIAWDDADTMDGGLRRWDACRHLGFGQWVRLIY